MARIIGLDPGSRHTGWAIIDTYSHRPPRAVVLGTVHMSASGMAERLFELQQKLSEVFERHKPSTAVVEKIFLGKNADSAFKLGHARGVCLMLAAKSGCQVHEYAARKVKQVITGSGAASKEQVRWLTAKDLGVKLGTDVPMDASDALSLALAHVIMANAQIKIGMALKGEVQA